MIDGDTNRFNHLESFIYEMLQEYLKLNRTFKLENIVPYINQKALLHSKNVSSESIKIVFESFLRKKIIAESSKLSKEDILKSKKRNIILGFILDNPGTNFISIVKNTGICDHLVAWHLNMLQKFQIISSTHLENNREIFFSHDIIPEQGIQFHYLSNSECKKLFNYIKKDDMGVIKSQLIEDLKMDATIIDKYIDILLDFKLILKKIDGNKEIYFLND